MIRRLPWSRHQVLFFFLLPALAIAVSIVGYYTYRTARQYDQLGAQSIAQSTLLLVREKVDRVEQQIIQADNAAFHLVDPARPKFIADTWPPLAERISPSIRAIVVLDEEGAIVGHATRDRGAERHRFEGARFRQIVDDLAIASEPRNQLTHLHRVYGGRSYLVSHKRILADGRELVLIAYHDTDHFVRGVFPELFRGEASSDELLFNVVDEDNRAVFGPSLARAGDYLVGLRFPTTLYGWRLQAAPQAVPQLEAQERSKRNYESALLAIAFGIVALGVLILVYAVEQERRLNSLKSEFIANVSHELKTPLSVIRMFGEMLVTGRVRSEEKRREYLEIIASESERLTSLIDNVLDFAALERGRQRYEMKPCDLGDVAARAIETLRYRVERDGADFRLFVKRPLPSVRADEQALLLVFINLLDNAVKYGRGTPIEVSVERRGTEVVVRVRDQGPGIVPEDLRRVFERFFRSSNRDPSARGSGIGLSLVKHIVEIHEGRTWAENAAGGGAAVSFALPIDEHAPPPKPSTDASAL